MASTLPLRPRVFVTGPPGIGKTTLIIRVLERLRAHQDKEGNAGVRIHGFYTQEKRGGKGERVGFEAVTVDGRRASLASSSGTAGPRVGKYAVDVAQFESLVLPELAPPRGGERDCGAPREVFIVDEVGKMELFSSAFFPAVWDVLDSGADAVLGSVPAPKRGVDISEVEMIKKRADVTVYTLTKDNRDAVADAVAYQFSSLLRL